MSERALGGHKKRVRVGLTLDPDIWHKFEEVRQREFPLFSKSRLIELIMAAIITAQEGSMSQALDNLSRMVAQEVKKKLKGGVGGLPSE